MCYYILLKKQYLFLYKRQQQIEANELTMNYRGNILLLYLRVLHGYYVQEDETRKYYISLQLFGEERKRRLIMWNLLNLF